eukprot:GHVT01059587.1.p1 GENE.GHVT01059587.1~~GHVT01059587.1.p1  ORF type:complete len:146 (-),score=11.44 GHVT01059587.1:6-443(-)
MGNQELFSHLIPITDAGYLQLRGGRRHSLAGCLRLRSGLVELAQSGAGSAGPVGGWSEHTLPASLASCCRVQHNSPWIAWDRGPVLATVPSPSTPRSEIVTTGASRVATFGVVTVRMGPPWSSSSDSDIWMALILTLPPLDGPIY